MRCTRWREEGGRSPQEIAGNASIYSNLAEQASHNDRAAHLGRPTIILSGSLPLPLSLPPSRPSRFLDSLAGPPSRDLARYSIKTSASRSPEEFPQKNPPIPAPKRELMPIALAALTLRSARRATRAIPILQACLGLSGGVPAGYIPLRALEYGCTAASD